VTCGFRADHWPLLRPKTLARLRDIPDYASSGAQLVSQHLHELDMPRIAALRADGALT
jgi:hypothetical protein